MHFLKKCWKGVLLCLIISAPSWYLGKLFPIVGGPIIAILLGICIALFLKRDTFADGISFTAKKVLQYSIVLLGFDMNLYNILRVGQQSLLIILSTISIALIIAWVVSKALKIPSNEAILIGVGSSICGGSAIAATAPVIEAREDEVAKSISTIFLFNVIAALIFPVLGRLMGMSDQGFGMWVGTAVNDTSSVVAAATTWSSAVGNNTALTLATIVKLTRTLAIIPITFALAIYRSKKEKQKDGSTFHLTKIFPWFVLFFLLAAIINTVFLLPSTVTKPVVELGKFMIIMAMAAIGLNTNIVKLVKSGGKAILLGFCCWTAVALTSLGVQALLHIL